jgi:hypothetical protein
MSGADQAQSDMATHDHEPQLTAPEQCALPAEAPVTRYRVDEFVAGEAQGHLVNDLIPVECPSWREDLG